MILMVMLTIAMFLMTIMIPLLTTNEITMLLDVAIAAVVDENIG
jgi:hypothetical protein